MLTRSSLRAASSLLLKPSLLLLPRVAAKRTLLTSEYPDFPLEVNNVTEHIMGRAARTFKDDVAIECVITQERDTFQEQYDQILAYSAGFTNLGLKKGDVVVVSLANGPLFPKVAFALANIGVTVSLLNPLYTSFEIGKILTMTEAKAVITQNILMPNLLEAVEALPKDSPIKIYVDNFEASDPRILPLSSVLAAAPFGGKGFQAPVFDYKKTTSFMPFSSGTTGPPKGVMLSHFATTASRDIHNSNMDVSYLREGGYLTIIPNFHIYGLIHVNCVATALGIKMLTMPIFDYDLFLHTLQERRPGGVALVPALAARMALDPNVTADHLSSLQLIACGGAPISPTIVDAFKAKARPNVNFWIGYGMTEFPTIAKGCNFAPNTTGKVQANVRTKFVDMETGESVGPGQKGEICVQGPHMMQGYYKNPVATAEIMIDGWLHTGDVGYYDESGNVTLVDRKKDLIKHKGFQVSPSELEEVIRQVPEVQEVCVVGVPDDKNGEVPKAFIIVKEGETLSEQQVHDLVNERLSSYKRLRGGVEFVGVLPTNPTGKVLRRALRN